MPSGSFATLKSDAARLRTYQRPTSLSYFGLIPKRQNHNFTPAGSLLSIHSAAEWAATRGFPFTVHWWLFGVARHSRDQSSTALLVHDAPHQYEEELSSRSLLTPPHTGSDLTLIVIAFKRDATFSSPQWYSSCTIYLLS